MINTMRFLISARWITYVKVDILRIQILLKSELGTGMSPYKGDEGLSTIFYGYVYFKTSFKRHGN